MVAPNFLRRIENLEVRTLLSSKFGHARKCAFLDQKYCCNVTVWELVRRWMQRMFWKHFTNILSVIVHDSERIIFYCGK